MINKKQDVAIFSIQFSVKLCAVNFKYFGGHPRICITFVFCKQSLDILEATWTLIFSSL
jgi:hypothetical protein